MRIPRGLGAVYALAITVYSLAMLFMVFQIIYGRIELPKLQLPAVEMPRVDLKVDLPQIELPKLPTLMPAETPVSVNLGSAWTYAEATATPAPAPTNTPAVTATPTKPTATPVNVLQVNTSTPAPTPKPCTWVTVWDDLTKSNKTMLVSEAWLIEHDYPTWPGCRE